MKTAPIFQLCAASNELTVLIGNNPVRLFLFGLAPQNPQTPYVVWQLISGSPENYLSGRPDTEGHTLQIDVYASSAAQSRQIAGLVESTIENDCYITRYGGEEKDEETMLYRSSFDVDWLIER